MWLRCPVCGERLHKETSCYVCQQQHNFDIAKAGYTNLLLRNSSHSGDQKEMVFARRVFLAEGYYEPLAEMLLQILLKYKPIVSVDAGCGEGYYTNRLAEQSAGTMLAFDMSKEALRYAAKRSDKASYFLASIFHLPLFTHSVDMLFNIFAPFAEAEFKRVLKHQGHIVKVDPGSQHLLEFKTVLYEHPYMNEANHVAQFAIEDTQELMYKVNLPKEALLNLYHMTPYAYKSPKQSLLALQRLECLEVTLHFVVSIYINGES